MSREGESPKETREILDFWLSLDVKKQFGEDKKLDAEIRERWGALHKKACAGGLEAWRETPEGALALVILLDQFSRNLHRGSPLAFAADGRALHEARRAIAKGFDLELPVPFRHWFYMPFMHSEEMEAQEEGLRFFEKRLDDKEFLRYAKDHAAQVRRFGRFPHRNRILGRESAEAERVYLAEREQRRRKGG